MATTAAAGPARPKQSKEPNKEPIFDLPIPLGIVAAFIAEICDRDGDGFIYNETAFRRMKYKDCYEPFVRATLPYCSYRMRELLVCVPTYKSVARVLRHVFFGHPECRVEPSRDKPTLVFRLIVNV
jgi:hypothetical protein